MIDSRYLLGWGKALKALGAMGFFVAIPFGLPRVAWASFALLATAFVLSGLGKAIHYRELALPTWLRAALVGSWLGVTATVVPFLYGWLRVAVGDGGDASWLLAIAGGGFALIHFGLQHEHLGGTAAPDEDRAGEAGIGPEG